ncbi:caib baif family enzyme [Ophiostoma piceae UAMH 11346]|uniref:Caib baif family enzyme n=1 Tax=Ophiostoma piceae (strain UAMH 11346) TaxID=1262450 RepID=S3C8U0_OPHP1|nr:caib baif family enzyme [Ophiostoma piceae UAMH 11346]
MASYSSLEETRRALALVLSLVTLPKSVDRILRSQTTFTANCDLPYFPIPLKESETTSALKAIEAAFAVALHNLRDASLADRKIVINHEKTTAFLFQAYLAKVGAYGKLDKEVKQYLKDTDLLQAQSDPYRRMSANLYETRIPGQYYHIHGSLEATTTLRMLGLCDFRPDLETHEAIVDVIESHVKQFSVAELEEKNAQHKQAGVPVLTHDEFLKTPHGRTNKDLAPWKVSSLETKTPPWPLPPPSEHTKNRPLAGIKVLELCRIIAGPIMGRILCEYGADVLKITSPHLSDVPFFQVDGNMGKHAANLDLKKPEGRAVFEKLVREADVVLDGYRPGALEKLGFGPTYMTKLAHDRGYGIVYVNENCFGYEGEWASRPGWQQIADCVTGVAWAQGQFMHPAECEPVVPPFPISDYGTGCMGAIAALTGLYYRSTVGGSWHGKASLMQYDLLLFKAGLLPNDVQATLRQSAGDAFLAMNHSHSVDQISGSALLGLRARHPQLFDDANILEVWSSRAYGHDVTVVKPVAQIEGLDIGFRRASRPNGTDAADWTSFAEDEGDYRK